ncbi:hypothetical protein LOC71_24000 [Rhodopirellula sp. JC740]|uniref:Uncharacterized protein n=1 Tax=Rhodopirellula halodulae TaxID=2894198 RepID=A0ABS8NP47_9BACT|nr:hypothetical protein [Rhodopirellula sp. JC740]MCC9645355.1 hypothetical protein [Rhodopirellula sp. JC740]
MTMRSFHLQTLESTTLSGTKLLKRRASFTWIATTLLMLALSSNVFGQPPFRPGDRRGDSYRGRPGDNPSGEYDLVEPNGVVTGRISLRRGRLIYRHGDGQQIVYSRVRRFDTPDRRFLGYYNTFLARVLKFPRSGFGNFLYADLDDFVPFPQSSYRFVRPAGLGPIAGPVYGPWAGGYVEWAGPLVNGVVWGHSNYGGFGLPQFGPAPSLGWTGFDLPLGPVPVSPIPLNPGPVPVDSRRVPLPDLAPANIQFTNSSERDVNVTLSDSRQAGLTKTFRLAPGETEAVKLRRDAGYEWVETYELLSPDGQWVTRETRRSIPAQPRYEIVVHEWRVQSVAIDRTARGNNRIEDINMQGRGIGRFLLPPGPELRDQTIDVFQSARAMQNQGSVTPIVPDEQLQQQYRPSDRVSPFERAILDQQRAMQRARDGQRP